jgi:hypothetical protein
MSVEGRLSCDSEDTRLGSPGVSERSMYVECSVRRAGGRCGRF